MTMEKKDDYFFFSSKILSPYKAKKQAQKWTELHDYRFLKDFSGFSWRVEIKKDQVPFEDDLKKLIWKVVVRIFQKIHINDFIIFGTLDSEKDSRIIHLLKEEKIFIAMAPYTFSSLKEEDSQRKFELFFPQLKRYVAGQTFDVQKRQCIEFFIEKITSFGGDRDGFSTTDSGWSVGF